MIRMASRDTVPLGNRFVAEDRSAPILVLTRLGQDDPILGPILADLGAEPYGCSDLAGLVASLHDGVVAAIAAEEMLAGAALDAFRRWLAAQPEWSDLPILVLADAGTAAPSRADLLRSLGYTFLLERPLGPETLRTAIVAAQRSRHRQRRFGRQTAERDAALEASEARFRRYFDSFPEPLFVLDVTGQAVHYADFNPQFERAFGPRRASAESEAPAVILPPELADRILLEVHRCLALGKTHRFTIDTSLKGEARRLDVALAPLHDTAGQIIRLLGAARDVTQQHAVEERLRQAQKLEALAQLTDSIAHDFNNLLQVFTSGLVLLDRTPDPGRRAKLLTPLHDAVQRGADLVRRLRAFSRPQTPRTEPIDLGHWLDAHARNLLSRALRGDILVRTRIAARIPTIEVDAAELELALLNIALNARDAMPAGGELLIEAELDQGFAATGPDRLDGEFVRLSITDSGTGMGAAVQARLFEPFFTTKPPGQGMGLGLAQVDSFVRASGGAVRIESEAGHGTRVTLLLPVRPSPPASTSV